jgi:hypothetical protein
VIGDALSFASALGYVSVYAHHLFIFLTLTISLGNDRKYTNGDMHFVEEL